MMEIKERYSRQHDLIPPERLEEVKATVIGVGAIGRQVAMQLAAIGVQHLQLIDFDSVEEANLAAQGFLEEDWNKDKPVKKVMATAKMCKRINGSCKIRPLPIAFNPQISLDEQVVFCCVDSMEARKHIWYMSKTATLFVDGRMNGEVMRILAADTRNKAHRQHYETTLFSDDEAQEGSCTAKTTIYTANIAGGLLVSTMARWMRGIPLDPDVLINLTFNNMTVLPTEIKSEGRKAQCACSV